MKKILQVTAVLLLYLAAFLPQPDIQSMNNSDVMSFYTEKVAFYSERDGNSEIYVINPDGSNEIRLTENEYQDITPDLSHKCNQIVFVSDRDGNNEIYKMNIDGSNTIRLTFTSYNESYPYWSPDDSTIIYCVFLNSNYDIFRMKYDGSNQTRITNTMENEEWANLSPDMSRIAYASGSFPDYDIYIIDSIGTNPSPLVVLPDIQAMPKWSPSGDTIAYNYGIFNSGNFTGDIYLINSDGSGNHRITNSGGLYIDENPCWSPHGDRIVFQSDRTDNFQLYIMNTNGSNQTQLTNHPGNDYWPSWASNTQTRIENQNESFIKNFFLAQNYPNPFNPTTSISYQIQERCFVTIKAYDVLGNEIATLVNEERLAGTYEVIWYAKGLPSGLYFYQLIASNPSTSSRHVFSETKKMVLLK